MVNKETLNISVNELKVLHNKPDNRFEIDLGDKKAVLVYMIKADLFLLLHTEVPPPFEGHGIAAKLAYETLEYAKHEGYKVRSYCSYTTRYIERHKEYQDILG